MSVTIRTWYLVTTVAIALGAVLLVQGLRPDDASGDPNQVKVGGTIKLTYATSITTLTQKDETPRLEVFCPRKKFPFGATMYGMHSMTNWEGPYPHSFERLGVQRGYHITPVLFSWNMSVMPYQVTLQVICGPKPGKIFDPHSIVTVGAHQSVTTTATCPGKSHLFAGGFNLTNFTSKGGDFATQSQATSRKQWTVSGSAFGNFGGDLASIGYCTTGGKPFRSIEGSTVIAPSTYGYGTTPPCPGKTRLIGVGYDTSPHGSITFAGGEFQPDQKTYVYGGYNFSSAPATLEGYGYCLNLKKAYGTMRK